MAWLSDDDDDDNKSLITNWITAGSPLASFSEALWSGVWTNANADLLSCHLTFETSYVYQAVIFPTKLIYYEQSLKI